MDGVEATTIAIPDSHTYELTFIDPGGPDDRKEYCEACGRQLVYVSNLGRGSLLESLLELRGGLLTGAEAVRGGGPSWMEGANE